MYKSLVGPVNPLAMSSNYSKSCLSLIICSTCPIFNSSLSFIWANVTLGVPTLKGPCVASHALWFVHNSSVFSLTDVLIR